jgi:hypothetical protein
MSEDINEQTKNSIEVWRNTRTEYPNWLIAPYSRRETLWQNTFNCIPIYDIKKIGQPNDIIILYEFDWRIEKVFYPLFSDWADAYRRVIDSYNPFPDKLDISESIDPIKNNKGTSKNPI